MCSDTGRLYQSDHFHWLWLLLENLPTSEDEALADSSAGNPNYTAPKHVTAHVLLQGNKLLVAAFHGGSFRDSKWAVFQWCQPLQIDFSASFMEKQAVEDMVGYHITLSLALQYQK